MIAKVAVVFHDVNVAHFSHQYVATGMPTKAALKVNIAKTYTT
jgi:P-type Ca2+ transporter type 2C